MVSSSSGLKRLGRAMASSTRTKRHPTEKAASQGCSSGDIVWGKRRAGLRHVQPRVEMARTAGSGRAKIAVDGFGRARGSFGGYEVDVCSLCGSLWSGERAESLCSGESKIMECGTCGCTTSASAKPNKVREKIDGSGRYVSGASQRSIEGGWYLVGGSGKGGIRKALGLEMYGGTSDLEMAFASQVRLKVPRSQPKRS